MHRPSLLLACAALTAPAAARTTWYVDVNGTPPGFGTQLDPYTSLQYGLAQASTVAGDTLLVLPGTYVRLGAVSAGGGTSQHAIGHGAGAGTFVYQLWFRSVPSTFCDPLAAFNLSNGLEVTWP